MYPRRRYEVGYIMPDETTVRYNWSCWTRLATNIHVRTVTELGWTAVVHDIKTDEITLIKGDEHD